jgi:hypothetical protein
MDNSGITYIMLPKTDKPIYTTTIPSSKKQVKYTPFTVKEEKLVLIANESADVEEIITSMKQLITNCVVDEIDVDSLAIFDIEYLYIQLKSRSVGNVIPCVITVGKDQYNVTIDLTKDIELNVPENHTNKIILSPEKGIGIVLNYPNVKAITALDPSSPKPAVDLIYNIIYDCTDMIFDNDSVYKKNTFTQKELSDWLDNLTIDQLNQILDFFYNQPRLVATFKYKDKEGTEQSFVTSRLQDFL